MLLRMGQLCNRNDDEAQAFHFHLESYRHYPVSLDVISWLGVWYVKSEMYEKAIHFFERAAQIQPKEVKWRLMVTSCYRRMGNYQRALELYEKVHAEHPENAECLRYLVAICKDLGQPCDHYQAKLSRLDQRERNRRSSPRGNSQGRRRNGSDAAATVLSPERRNHHHNNNISPLPKLGASPTRTRSGRGRPPSPDVGEMDGRTTLMMRTPAGRISGGHTLPGMRPQRLKAADTPSDAVVATTTSRFCPRRSPNLLVRIRRRGQNIGRIDAGRYTSLDARAVAPLEAVARDGRNPQDVVAKF